MRRKENKTEHLTWFPDEPHNKEQAQDGDGRADGHNERGEDCHRVFSDVLEANTSRCQEGQLTFTSTFIQCLLI